MIRLHPYFDDGPTGEDGNGGGNIGPGGSGGGITPGGGTGGGGTPPIVEYQYEVHGFSCLETAHVDNGSMFNFFYYNRDHPEWGDSTWSLEGDESTGYISKFRGGYANPWSTWEHLVESTYLSAQNALNPWSGVAGDLSIADISSATFDLNFRALPMAYYTQGSNYSDASSASEPFGAVGTYLHVAKRINTNVYEIIATTDETANVTQLTGGFSYEQLSIDYNAFLGSAVFIFAGPRLNDLEMSATNTVQLGLDTNGIQLPFGLGNQTVLFREHVYSTGSASANAMGFAMFAWRIGYFSTEELQVYAGVEGEDTIFNEILNIDTPGWTKFADLSQNTLDFWISQDTYSALLGNVTFDIEISNYTDYGVFEDTTSYACTVDNLGVATSELADVEFDVTAWVEGVPDEIDYADIKISIPIGYLVDGRVARIKNVTLTSLFSGLSASPVEACPYVYSMDYYPTLSIEGVTELTTGPKEVTGIIDGRGAIRALFTGNFNQGAVATLNPFLTSQAVPYTLTYVEKEEGLYSMNMSVKNALLEDLPSITHDYYVSRDYFSFDVQYEDLNGAKDIPIDSVIDYNAKAGKVYIGTGETHNRVLSNIDYKDRPDKDDLFALSGDEEWKIFKDKLVSPDLEDIAFSFTHSVLIHTGSADFLLYGIVAGTTRLYKITTSGTNATCERFELSVPTVAMIHSVSDPSNIIIAHSENHMDVGITSDAKVPFLEEYLISDLIQDFPQSTPYTTAVDSGVDLTMGLIPDDDGNSRSPGKIIVTDILETYDINDSSRVIWYMLGPADGTSFEQWQMIAWKDGDVPQKFLLAGEIDSTNDDIQFKDYSYPLLGWEYRSGASDSPPSFSGGTVMINWCDLQASSGTFSSDSDNGSPGDRDIMMSVCGSNWTWIDGRNGTNNTELDSKFRRTTLYGLGFEKAARDTRIRTMPRSLFEYDNTDPHTVGMLLTSEKKIKTMPILYLWSIDDVSSDDDYVGNNKTTASSSNMFMHTTSFVKSTDENSLFSDRGGNPEKWDSIVDWTTLVDGVETNHAGETNYLTWNNTAYQSICLADADVDHFGHYHPGYSHDMHIASFGPGLDGSTDTIYRFFTPILNKGNISPENFLPRNSSMYYNKSKKALIYTQFSKSTNRAIYLSKEYLDKSKITGKVNIDASLHGATTEVTNTDDDGNTTTTTVYSGFYWDAQRYDYKIRILAGNDTVSVPLDNDVIEMSPIYWDTSGVLWPSVLKGDAVILNHQEPSEHIIATATFGSTHRGVVVNLNEINGEIIPTLNEVCLFDNSITNSVHPSALLFTDTVRAQGEVNIETDGTLNTNSGNFNFSTNEYFYKYSFLYDGFQDGPLCSLEVMANGTLTGTGDYADAIEISMTLRGVPARVTHINLWRKDNRDAEYRIVKSIKYDSSWKYEPLVSSEPSTLISGRAQKRIIDRGGQYASYEALSGMPETINNFTIGYKYSTEINGELFIAGCKADFIDSSENFIFKSQPGKFSMFNWLDFRIDLKDTVVGIENYLGRVYAFTKDNCYVINPASMSVDDVYHGLGIKHSKCVYANKHGLVVASNDNIYLNIQGGMAFTPIGNAIYTSNDKSITETWQNIDKQTIKIGWSEKKSSYIIFFHDGKQKAWLFNPQSTRWDLIDFPVDVKDITTSIDGLTVYSTGTNLYSMFTSPLKRVWKWFSKAFTVGNPTQDKFFRKLKFTNTLKDKFPDVVTTVEGSSIFIDNPQYDLKKENIEIDIKKTAKWFKIKMFDKTFRESKIDSLGLLFRRKSAK